MEGLTELTFGLATVTVHWAGLKRGLGVDCWQVAGHLLLVNGWQTDAGKSALIGPQ